MCHNDTLVSKNDIYYCNKNSKYYYFFFFLNIQQKTITLKI